MKIKKLYTWKNFVDWHHEPMKGVTHFIHELNNQSLKNLRPFESIRMNLNSIRRLIKLYMGKTGEQSGPKLLRNKDAN